MPPVEMRIGEHSVEASYRGVEAAASGKCERHGDNWTYLSAGGIAPKIREAGGDHRGDDAAGGPRLVPSAGPSTGSAASSASIYGNVGEYPLVAATHCPVMASTTLT